MGDVNQVQGKLPMLPLRGLAVFPNTTVCIDVGRDRSLAALEAAMGGDRHILLVAQRNVNCEQPERADLYTMGTVDSEKVAAWLDASASPGEYGNAIFNGHVSWKKVAGVFSVLPKMEEGEEIIVEYDDGSTMTFTVTNVDIYGIDDVPETVMAYDTGDSRMTLITCYGESWNSGLGTRNQRCVVVAKPVDSSKIITPPAVTPNPDEDCDT